MSYKTNPLLELRVINTFILDSILLTNDFLNGLLKAGLLW
jgi:hypothetical protein